MPHLLTKSDYMLYLKHPAWLWLKINDKTKLPPVEDGLQAIFDAGHTFEPYVESLFQGGVKLGFSDYGSYSTLTARTTKAIESGAKNIFQGRFESGACTFICDIVTITGDKLVDLCEIKSGTHVKDDHIYDLAFQMVVLERCGYSVGKISVAHVNSEYVRNREIDATQLVEIDDVTDLVKSKHEFTMSSIDKVLSIARSTAHPDLSPKLCGLGSLKEWIGIYKTMVNVGEGSIYDLCRLTPELVGELESRGIKKLQDIPDDIALNKFQSRQVDAAKSNVVHTEPDMISALIGEYQYPLYFFDYETFATAVPEFDGLSPYDQIPFQYSLHVIDEPGAPVRHLEYLHDQSSNPVKAICESLRSHFGPTGSIVAWYAIFEKARNKRLAELLPEYTEFLNNLNSRIVDLMDPFAAGFYIDKRFHGSTSIKKVLPVLVPELSYNELDIREGGSASRQWADAVLYEKPGFDKKKILSDLKEYCKLDTYAMVKIYEALDYNNLHDPKKP